MRVALLPDSIKRLVAKKLEVVVQSGAGAGACASDAEYEAAGARIAADAKAALEGCQAVVKVQPPTDAELALLPRGIALISLMYPLARREAVAAAAAAGISVVSLDAVPRTTLAQMMDVLGVPRG